MILKYINFLIICNFWKIVSSDMSKWNLYGKPGDGYYLTVNIGKPPQTFNLVVDTGSSNLAVAGSTFPGLESYFEPLNSTSFINNGTAVKVAYTQGWWTGIIGKDYVHILSLENILPVMTDIAIITGTNGFYVNNSHWQGILGLAYSAIAKPEDLVKSWFDAASSEYPNVLKNKFDLELCGPQPFPNRTVHIGRFSVGTSEYSCPKSEYSTPIHHQWFYEVIITGFKVGEFDVSIPCPDFNSPKTIVDSGTSNLKLSVKSFYYVISELQSQTEKILSLSHLFWDGLEDICFSPNENPWLHFPSLTIFLNHDNSSHFGIEIPPNSYLRPAFNSSNSTRECWRLGIEKSQIGTVLGAVLLEGLCVLFDREEQALYFSEVHCGPKVVLHPLTKKQDSSSCNVTVFNGALIAAIIILFLVLIPLIFAFVRWVWNIYRKTRVNTNNVPFLSLDESNT